MTLKPKATHSFGEFEESWKKLDSLWKIFIDSADAFSSKTIGQFLNMVEPNGGSRNVKIVGWAYTRFGISTTWNVCSELRDIARASKEQ